MGLKRRPITDFWCTLLIAVTVLTGCHPTQPFYLHDRGDLDHFLNVATEIEHSDVYTATLPEAKYSERPRTVSHPEFEEIWELSLEDSICIALQNSKVLRTFGGRVLRTGLADLSAPEQLSMRTEFAPTVYNPAIQESDPDVGVEGVLSAFDAELATSMFWERRDRPRNFISTDFFTAINDQTLATAEVSLSKRTVPGTQFSIRNRYQFDHTRVRALTQPLSSIWTAEWEMEARHPLLRGGGTEVNRVPVTLARIRTDVSLADFEDAAITTVAEVESSYWQLYCSYRDLAAVQQARDSALVTWRKVDALAETGLPAGAADKLAQAEQQYFDFRSRVESALHDVYQSEGRLRYLMGLAATDQRLIRPSDEPITARIHFDWNVILCESLSRRVEIRRQKWLIKQRELELIAARNQLLPRMDLVGLYRFVGVGDELITADRRGLNFPAVGSTAYDELTENRYQEYLFGFELDLPVGFRRELAGVRNGELKLLREKALLEDLELEINHQLTSAIRDLDVQHALTQTNFNRWVSAQREVDAVQAAYEVGTVTLDLLLDAQRRRAEAKSNYYRSLCDYNKSISQVHLRKGSLLDFTGVGLAEGPWTQKAYWDAQEQARKRSAGHLFDYGIAQSQVVSRGPVLQNSHTSSTVIPSDPPAPAESIEPSEPTPAEHNENGIDESPDTALPLPDEPFPFDITERGDNTRKHLPASGLPASSRSDGPTSVDPQEEDTEPTFDWRQFGTNEPPGELPEMINPAELQTSAQLPSATDQIALDPPLQIDLQPVKSPPNLLPVHEMTNDELPNN